MTKYNINELSIHNNETLTTNNITRGCVICGEATESIETIVCEECKAAILDLREINKHNTLKKLDHITKLIINEIDKLDYTDNKNSVTYYDNTSTTPRDNF